MPSYFDLVVRVLKLENSDSSESIRDGLTLLADQTRAVCQSLTDDTRGISLDDRLPVGYLSKTIDRWTIAVPWCLVDHFPDDLLLREFCTIADIVKVGSDSNLCLSGSSCGAGLSREIGDIDFSEYIFDDSSTISYSIRDVLIKSFPNAVPVEVKLFFRDNIKIICPWPNDDKDYNESHHIFINEAGTSVSKTDFIGSSGAYGYIPVTNVVMPSVKSPTKGGLSTKSFSFQEAVFLADVNKFQWPLMSVEEIHSYVKFLISDIHKHLADRPIKAAKRASALVRLLNITEYDVELASLLKSEEAIYLSRRARWAETTNLVAQLRTNEKLDESWELVLEKIHESAASSEAGSPERGTSAPIQDCAIIVERLVGDIRSKIGRFDKELEDTLFNGLP